MHAWVGPIHVSRAYVHVHATSTLALAWETHYVGNVRSVNAAPLDNYLLKSGDVLHMPSPLGLTPADTVVGAEHVDGREQHCIKDKNHDAMAARLQRSKASGETLVDSRGRERDGTHSLSYTERFEAVTRFCYDVIIRCTGFDWDSSLFVPGPGWGVESEGGRRGTKYPRMTAEYEACAIPGLYFVGTITHIRDKERFHSAGGFVHGFRYTARALFKWLESKNHGVAWPRDHLTFHSGGGGGGEGGELVTKLFQRADTSSGLYQMFGVLHDVILLPPRNDSSSCQQGTMQARVQYLEEVPGDLVPRVVGIGRTTSADHHADRSEGSDGAAATDGKGFEGVAEFITLSMGFGPEFAGHERVLGSERVFHDFDPKRAFRSQFLHPILRYYRGPGTAGAGSMPKVHSEHHVLEDTLTDFSSEILHKAPLRAWLEHTMGGAREGVPEPPPFTGWPKQ